MSKSTVVLGIAVWGATSLPLMQTTCIAQEKPSAPAATQPEQPRREVRDLAIPDNVDIVRDVIYATAPGDDGKPIALKMDTAFPKRQADDALLPVIVYIHGGGWNAGSKEAGFRQMVGFAAGGYFAVSINYRLSGQAKYPAAVHDCKAAIRFIRAHADELGIDQNRIGVWGHSAGAHLAALLGTSGNTSVLDGKVGDADPAAISSAVQCVVDFSGPVDLRIDGANGPIAQWFGGPLSQHQDLARQASPLTYIDADDPPVLIVHGTKDQTVNIRQAVLFEKALKDGGVQVEYMPIEGAGHGVADPAAYIRTAEFFDQHLGGKAAERFKEVAKELGAGLARRAGDGAATRPTSQPAMP